MSFKEVIELKDQILKNNRELEIRLKNQIENYSTQFSNSISNFQKEIKEINENNNKVMSSIPDINFHISKINQLEKFDLKMDNKLSSHDLRITTILAEIEKIKTKYDKIVLDNLYIPGHVGAKCQYQNLSEYLSFNVNEVSLLKTETEQLKKDTKNMKTKHDNTIKQMVNIIDGSVKRCNEYTDNKQKDFQLLLDTRMKEFNEKIMEIRMNVCKMQMKTEEEYNNLNIEFHRLSEEKKQFTNFFQNKLILIKKELSKFQKEYKTNKNDFKQKNQNLGNDVKNIKDNISNLINLIQFYQKKQKIDIHQSNNFDLNLSSGEDKKSHILKGNKAIFGKEFDTSNNRMININKSVGTKHGNIVKNRRNSINKNINISNSILNNINDNNTSNNNNNFRRSIKKRNTMFYTGPILKLQNNNKTPKDNNQLTNNLYGLMNPILHNIVDGPKKEEKENKKSSSSSNSNSKSSSDSESKFTIIYSDRTNSKEKDKDKKKDNKKINNNDENKKDNNSLTHSNITSKYDSDRSSNSDLNLKSDDNDDNSQKKSNFNFTRKKKKSNSKQYFSRLSLKPNTIKEIKKSVKSNTKLLHVKFNGILKNPLSKNKITQKKTKFKKDNNVKILLNENINNKKKKSISSVHSVGIKYNNKDITDILDKKIYINSKSSMNNNIKEIKENKNIKNTVNPLYKSSNKNNDINMNMNMNNNIKNNDNEEVKNNTNTNSNSNNINTNFNSKNNLKNDNLSKMQNKIIECSQSNLNSMRNKNNNLIKNINTLNPVIQNSKLGYLNIAQKNSIIYANNFSNTINIYSSISKNHKINFLTPQKENLNKRKKINNKNINLPKNIEIDSDTGVGCNIVSFKIPENTSLPPKTNQFYPLYGKKLHKKPPIKTEILSPVDEIYRQQYNKKIKLENLSNSNSNDMPKKIAPVFGRTAYAFYSKKDIEEFSGSANSINLKGNNNFNILNNNYNNIANNNMPIDLKFFSKGKQRYINEADDE